tara:strand:+ start:760 stop:1866 length:1107 start_codon:yes stop_codon:yes gene_type:complete
MSLIKLQVKTSNQKYPIIIGVNLINNLKRILKNNSILFDKSLIVIDRNVPKYQLKKIFGSLKSSNKFIFYFNASEKNKSQKYANEILEILLKKSFNRNDCIISVGGGITGDITGFVSSIFKRGIKFINIPTTLLSQVDSSIGGKTGINTKYGKNLIGSFYQPNLVIADTDFLKSLPKRELICGYGEILKHALIDNKTFFYYLEKNFTKIMQLKSPFIEKSIYQSCLIKRRIIQIDETELGLRKILNLGHTFAHAYEAVLGYSKKLNHGEAVLLGIISSCKFSLENKLISKKDHDLIQNHLIKFNLPYKVSKYCSMNNLNKIITFMQKDKKNNSSKINLVLLKDIGKPLYNMHYDYIKIKSFIKKELNK